MSWVNKLLGKKENKDAGAAQSGTGEGSSSVPGRFKLPGLESKRFGRYSDNNKTYAKTQSWYKAEDLFKEKKYNEAFLTFFEYLKDEEEANVHFHQEGDHFTFDILQGSKKVHGRGNGKEIIACVPLAQMPEPNTAVMRRLLDLNFNMYYSRTALDDKNVLSMIFDTDTNSANTNKLYYALRELATKADRLDDLLLADFSTLSPIGTDHIQPLSPEELDLQYRYYRKWIEDNLKIVDELNQDSFSGAIAYLLPVIIYRIDFLITPEAKMLAEMERISSIYWARKEDTTLVERNQLMKDSIRKMLETTKEQFAANVYHSKATFAISTPAKPEKIRENIYSANKDSRWYIENKYPDIALALVEYGLLYSQFIYSMPALLTELTTVFMAVIHAQYFTDCGLKEPFYNIAEKTFEKKAIEAAVDSILQRHREKFKTLKWDHSRLRYDSLYDFGVSFSEQMANLNLETKR